jgi:hypothetical protein
MEHSSIVHYWISTKKWCKATFHEEPSLISLGEMRPFKKELALLVKNKFIVFSKDVESLTIGAQYHMLAFLDFLNSRTRTSL